eukprot:TRINITY_DN4078_c0_g1_i1.p2 TRINITY_DN4078_c0_g1~~TRINITY_DN4078_c0_g1_i1.p2  ORF type:complete len:211 (+),score=-7.00 TRINITY_DN4078_c0_g1_i1:1-633(+)
MLKVRFLNANMVNYVEFVIIIYSFGLQGMYDLRVLLWVPIILIIQINMYKAKQQFYFSGIGREICIAQEILLKVLSSLMVVVQIQVIFYFIKLSRRYYDTIFLYLFSSREFLIINFILILVNLNILGIDVYFILGNILLSAYTSFMKIKLCWAQCVNYFTSMCYIMLKLSLNTFLYNISTGGLIFFTTHFQNLWLGNTRNIKQNSFDICI